MHNFDKFFYIIRNLLFINLDFRICLKLFLHDLYNFLMIIITIFMTLLVIIRVFYLFQDLCNALRCIKCGLFNNRFPTRMIN